MDVYEPWLIEHQPTISIDEFVVKLRAHPDAICITSWAIASTFLRYAPNIHFWDMELSHTANDHFATLLKLYQTDRIRRVAGISRTIQAWHMAHFGQECTIVPNLIDLDRWQPDPTMRIPGRIGYMNEGQHTKAFVSLVGELLANRHGHVEFFQIRAMNALVWQPCRHAICSST